MFLDRFSNAASAFARNPIALSSDNICPGHLRHFFLQICKTSVVRFQGPGFSGLVSVVRPIPEPLKHGVQLYSYFAVRFKPLWGRKDNT
jgi:hypothetical protein